MPDNKKAANEVSTNLDEIESLSVPAELPVLPLRQIVVFPYSLTPLVIGRPKSIKLIDEALVSNKTFAVVTQKNPEADDPKPDDLYEVATAVRSVKMLKFPDGTLRVLVQGIARVKIKQYSQTEPYFKAQVEKIEDIAEESVEFEALTRNVLEQFQKVVSASPLLADELQVVAINLDDPSKLSDFIATNISMSIEEKYRLLSEPNLKKRFEILNQYFTKEIELLEVRSKIQSDVESQMDKTQREYVLRRQMEAIKKELGETDETAREIDELRGKIKQAHMPEEAEKAANHELDRLSKMHPAAAEYSVARTYLDWLITMPWDKHTEDNLDVEKAQQILDEDHYDLDKVKQRILEYLAVLKLKGELHGPILCFVGPPGVGKTSLGKSIARALGRKFIRASLGGIRDEAEIRGHRRTYVGALPGRIIQNIKKAESNNPVFMLDEVDKIGSDFRGDPSSALLEVLDPEQNQSFSDNYLEVAFDLSKVMFITTANLMDPIPPALRDRMEVIFLSGYTVEEKVHIAKNHLIPRQLTEHGLNAYNITFTDEALKAIIANYTREAGVRNLEREIANILRKVALKITKNSKEKITVKQEDLHDYLGPIKFFSEVSERLKNFGVATGMAWTQYGGEIIFVESTKMQGGKGGLLLTGQLGDVMKESAQAALSYVRTNASRLGIDMDAFKKYDIHLHVPAGAVPKDGPSAGVTMVTSLVSLFKEEPVRQKLSMTGEITLRGKVMPVGGIKEKVLAASRAGIETIILPGHNKKDLEDVPEEIRKSVTFHFAETIDDVINVAFDKGKKKKSTSKKSTKKSKKKAKKKKTKSAK